MKPTIMDRMTALMNEKDINQAELSKRTGITQSSLSDYIKGKYSPKQDKIDLIARALGVSPAYLMGWNETKPSEDKQAKAFADAVIIEMPESVLIPVYGTISAGVPLEAIEDIDEHIDIPADWIKTGKQFIGLKIKGDSMYPKYWEGDTVVVEINPCPNSGEDCVVYVNGYEATVKQVKLYENGSIELIPKNPVYPPKIYNKGECTVVGIVREMRRKV